ncbi:MAG: 16S rRNA (cytosine(1402)-N(4))-methyltransferase RsmH [Leptospirales bacterium]
MDKHKSVLLHEFLELSSGYKNSSLWDGTLGAAGHFRHWLQQHPDGFGYGSDTDPQMLAMFSPRLINDKSVEGRFELAKGEYSQNPFSHNAPFDLIFLDLGISSLHLDEFQRGISFRDEQPLDMRLDPTSGEPLSEYLKTARFEDLLRILSNYGEEKLAARIAKGIIDTREKEDIVTNAQLRKICEDTYPAAWKLRGDSHSKRNPAVKTFQAFRIYINNELDNLEKALAFIPELLAPGGRLFIITFHSLEDRLVKHSFIERTRVRDLSPTAKSYYQDGDFKIITKKPIEPTEAEKEENPRSRSAKMRVLERRMKS